MVRGVWIGPYQMLLGVVSYCSVGTLEVNLILPAIWKRGQSVAERADMMLNVV
jgi:hypothetical protein